MKNVVLDIMMGMLCMLLVVTLIGMIFIPEVLDAWSDMRAY